MLPPSGAWVTEANCDSVTVTCRVSPDTGGSWCLNVTRGVASVSRDPCTPSYTVDRQMVSLQQHIGTSTTTVLGHNHTNVCVYMYRWC